MPRPLARNFGRPTWWQIAEKLHAARHPGCAYSPSWVDVRLANAIVADREGSE